MSQLLALITKNPEGVKELTQGFYKLKGAVSPLSKKLEPLVELSKSIAADEFTALITNKNIDTIMEGTARFYTLISTPTAQLFLDNLAKLSAKWTETLSSDKAVKSFDKCLDIIGHIAHFSAEFINIITVGLQLTTFGFTVITDLILYDFKTQEGMWQYLFDHVDQIKPYRPYFDWTLERQKLIPAKYLVAGVSWIMEYNFSFFVRALKNRTVKTLQMPAFMTSLPESFTPHTTNYSDGTLYPDQVKFIPYNNMRDMLEGKSLYQGIMGDDIVKFMSADPLANYIFLQTEIDGKGIYLDAAMPTYLFEALLRTLYKNKPELFNSSYKYSFKQNAMQYEELYYTDHRMTDYSSEGRINTQGTNWSTW